MNPQPAQSQAAVAKLHADFCAAAGRAVPVRFYERAWYELLRSPEYDYDAARLGADVAHLVRYLKREIAREKRNPGALKLANFLQPDKFAEDLAEARVGLRPLSPAAKPKIHHAEAEGLQRPQAEQEEEIRRKAAEHFKQFTREAVKRVEDPRP